jgi:cell division inhibitor SepF
MALRDTWHRALVYFGLAEDPEYHEHDVYEPDTAPHGQVYEPAPNRHASVSRISDRRRSRDEIDDIFADDEPRPRGRTLRPVGNGGSADVQVHLVTPSSFNDAQEVADQFKRSIPVILNLQATEGELAKRLIDFASGLTYALDGGMQKIAEKTFLLTPRNVEVSAEEKARLVEKGFFNQS